MQFAYNRDGSITSRLNSGYQCALYHRYMQRPVLLSASLDGISCCAYLIYDCFGRRLRKNGCMPTCYRRGVDRHNALVMDDHVNDTQTIYLSTPAGQAVRLLCGAYVKVSRDHLGSVRIEKGQFVPAVSHYSPYGRMVSFNCVMRRGFDGYEYDAEFELYTTAVREYSPSLARFTTVDPKHERTSPYVFAEHDPLNRVDPSGGMSASAITGMITGFLLALSIVISVATVGAALPETFGGMIPFIVLSVATTSVLSGSAALIAGAASGEHITGMYTLQMLLIEPAVMTIAAFLSMGVVGALSSLMQPSESAIISALMHAGHIAGTVMLTTAVSGVASGAINSSLQYSKTWSEIGISMAISVGEALVLGAIGRGINRKMANPWSRFYDRSDPIGSLGIEVDLNHSLPAPGWRSMPMGVVVNAQQGIEYTYTTLEGLFPLAESDAADVFKQISHPLRPEAQIFVESRLLEVDPSWVDTVVPSADGGEYAIYDGSGTYITTLYYLGGGAPSSRMNRAMATRMTLNQIKFGQLPAVGEEYSYSTVDSQLLMFHSD